MTSFNTATWMRDMFDTIKDRTLGEICMPGSHDSAMSIATSCTQLGAECNTRTQDRNIADQLADGVRYFDIRALIGRGCSKGEFRTGHFGYTFPPFDYQGCFGEQMSEVLSAVAGFAKSHPSEFIILDITHFLSFEFTDVKDYEGIPNSLIDYVHAQLNGVQFKGAVPSKTLGSYTFKELLSFGNVLTVFGRLDASNPEKGAYCHSDLSIYDEYSNTDDVSNMMKIQWKHFDECSSPRGNGYFMTVAETEKAILSSLYPNLICFTQTHVGNPAAHYILGQSVDKKFFIRKIDDSGKLEERDCYSATWTYYYEHFSTATCVIDIPPSVYSQYTMLLAYSKGAEHLFIVGIARDGTLGDQGVFLKVTGAVFTSFQVGNEIFYATQDGVSKVVSIHKLSFDHRTSVLTDSKVLDEIYTTFSSISHGGRTYIIGQSSSTNTFFMRGVNSNGMLDSADAYKKKWQHFYATISPFSLSGRTFISGQSTFENRYYIDEVTEGEGKLRLDTTNIQTLSWTDGLYGSLSTTSFGSSALRVIQRDSDPTCIIDKLTPYSMFLLSWTLTQSADSAAFCRTFSSLSIMNRADVANGKLAEQLNEKIKSGLINKSKIPNIITVDDSSAALSSEAIRLNLL